MVGEKIRISQKYLSEPEFPASPWRRLACTREKFKKEKKQKHLCIVWFVHDLCNFNLLMFILTRELIKKCIFGGHLNIQSYYNYMIEYSNVPKYALWVSNTINSLTPYNLKDWINLDPRYTKRISRNCLAFYWLNCYIFQTIVGFPRF